MKKEFYSTWLGQFSKAMVSLAEKELEEKGLKFMF